MDELTLFDPAPFTVATPDSAEPLSADRKRTLRQAARLADGIHPMQPVVGHSLKLHPQAAPHDDQSAEGRRCGNCRFRTVLAYHNRSYPKCTHPGGRSAEEYEKNGPPYVTHGAASDVRAWWPGCVEHVYGDPKLSPDAARHVPEAVSV